MPATAPPIPTRLTATSDATLRPDTAIAEVRVLDANAPLGIDDPNTAWEVLEGELDVFFVAPAEKGRAQPRHFVMTLEPDDVIAAPRAPATTGTLIAVGVLGTKVRARPLASLFASLFAAHGDGAAPPQLVALATRVVDTWARATDDSRRVGPTLVGLDTATCLAHGTIAAAFAAASTEFMESVTRQTRVDAASEMERVAHRIDGEHAMQTAGLAALGMVLGRHEVAERVAVTADPLLADPLLAACNAVGESLGVVFRQPPGWETSSRARDPLAALCRVSRVRHRRVALRGEWWKADNGPLLGRIAATNAPVALLASRVGHYEMVDPPAGTATPVTSAVAATLDPFAHVFYAPGPSAPMGVRDIARLATQGVRHDLGTVLLLAAATSIVGLAVPIATGKVFSAVIPNSQMRDALALLGSLVGLALGSLLFTLSRAYALIRFEGRSSGALQSALVDRLLSLPVGFFRRFSVGELAQRAGAVSVVRDALSGATMSSLLGALVALANFALLFRYSWKLALVAIGVLVVASLVIVGAGWRTIRLQRRESAAQRGIAALLFQMLGGIAKLRVAGAERRAFAVWCARFAEQKTVSYRAGLTSLGVTVFNDALPTLSTLALFWAAEGMVGQESGLDVGSFIAFNTAFGSFLSAGLSLAGTAITLMALVPTLEAAAPILTATPEVQEARPDPGGLAGRVEATHLTFRYDPSGPAVLEDVSFVAEPGEFVALVGPSGSGKSTVMRLLLGFEAAERGAIYFDRQDLAAIDVSAVRSQIGVVLQSSRLIAGDVFTNIVGAAPLTLDDAWSAAEQAGLGEDIRAMPMGMQTVVSEGGTTLSGGQRQRLLIARALVRQPRLIFFDEATSALDNRTQEVVSRSLEELRATRIVIAHRLSTIRHADRIYVLDRGRVVQQGTYDELMSQDGLFARLVARQLA